MLRRAEPSSPAACKSSAASDATGDETEPTGKPSRLIFQPTTPAKASSAHQISTLNSQPSSYGLPFWFTYLANTSLMLAISLLFRYADFVTHLGGTEFNLGLIVGIGMGGSLLMRLVQGNGIDLYGPRQVWLWSILFFIASCVGHLWVTRVDTPLVFVLRTMLSTSVAGAFGAAITYISLKSPVVRLAEVLGTLGTSGFVGMVAGTLIGDFLLGSAVITRADLDRMFLVAAALGCLGLAFAALATIGVSAPAVRRRPSMWPLLWRYQPGAILIVGIASGFGLGLPGTFLRTFAANLGIARIGIFFAVYAPVAFLTRICMRRLPEKIGVRPTALAGLASMTLSLLLFLLVRREWQFAIPATFMGIAHAMLFPSVVAGGSSVFPGRYRGLGTTLMLATFDLGNLVGAPIAGHLVDYTGSYPTMFIIVAAMMASVAVLFACSRRGVNRPGERKKRK
jgi:MFS family permease